MNYLITLCDRLGILRSEIDSHVLRASMVLYSSSLDIRSVRV